MRKRAPARHARGARPGFLEHRRPASKDGIQRTQVMEWKGTTCSLCPAPAATWQRR